MEFPEELELVGFIIGGIAFLMAVQPFTQAIWGRPRIKISYNHEELASGRVLQCNIHNVPIQNRILKFMFVSRNTAENIMAVLGIEEYGTGRVLLPALMPEIKTHTGYAAQRISLPAAIMPAMFGVVVAEQGKVFPFGRDVSEPILPMGVYVANIDIEIGGKIIRERKNFIVSNAHPYAYWEA